MLLSRVAANLYWAARYLERAEGTARVVREHTSLFMDVPNSLQLSWDPLLAVCGVEDVFEATSTAPNEETIVDFLVADLDNAGSIRSSVGRARENLRSAREAFPASAWVVVNDLYLYVESHVEEGVHRRSRDRFLASVVTEHQRLLGVIASMMTRDDAYTMLRLGRHVERADMTSRVLDVRAGQLLTSREAATELYDDLQWMSMLRSLSAAQMYQRQSLLDGGSQGPIGFVLHQEAFPRSVRYCLGAARQSAARLPNPDLTVAACDRALDLVNNIRLTSLDAAALHWTSDQMQLAIAAIHNAISTSYFPTVAV
jgi:uncharacterized alpha-E superfamily protein